MKHQGRIFGLALAFLGGAAALPASAETLSGAIAHAYQTNPGLEAQRAAMRSVDETYVQARAGFGPSLQIGASASYNSTTIAGQARHASGVSEQASLSQNLYTGGRLSARLRGAEEQVRAARESLRNVEMDFLVRVVNAYSGVRRDEEVLRISQQSVAALQKQLDDANALYQVRRNTLTDVDQSRARVASAKSQVLAAERFLLQSKAQYRALVGREPEALELEPEVLALPMNLNAAIATAEQNNADLKRALHLERASRQRIAEARGARLPSLSARVGAERGPYLPYADDPTQESLTGTLTLSAPIFNGGVTTSLIRQAIEDNTRDRLLVEDARRAMVQDVSIAWDQLNSARKALVTLEQEMKALETAFVGVRTEERFGQRSAIEVLNAQLELQSAQTAMIRGRADEYISRVRLLSALGVLKPEVLSSAATSYDPAGNFTKVRNRFMTPTEWVGRTVDGIGALNTTKEGAPQVIASMAQGNEALSPVPAQVEITPANVLLQRADAQSQQAQPPARPAAPTPNR